MKKEEIFYIPSLSSTATFKELTIGQYKNIFQSNSNKPFLNIGFNIELLKTIQQNNIDKVALTCFDKYIIAYQMRCSLFNKQIIQQDIEHPKQKIIQGITCYSPSLEEDQNYYKFINLLSKEQTDELLLAEIAKHISTNDYLKLEEKINYLKELPVTTLAEIVNYIDSIKNAIKQYYTKNNGHLIEYGIKLILP